MFSFSPSVRISFGLVLIAMSIILLGNLVGLIPDKSVVVLEARKKAAESLAVTCTVAARGNDVAMVQSAMNIIVDRYPEVLSLGLRGEKGRYLAMTRGHDELWEQPAAGESSPTSWQVPIYNDTERWATLEIRFIPSGEVVILGYTLNPFTLLLIFFALFCFMGFLLFMKRTLHHLDPTSVIPTRVKYALDILNEGVVIVDSRERILLANMAFAKYVDYPAESLVGLKASDFKWKLQSEKDAAEFPWVLTLASGKKQTGTKLGLSSLKRGKQVFIANSAPILDNSGKSRGVLATFSDVTELEKRNVQLSEMLSELEVSRDEVQRQNVELEILATQDPLTGCLNRRAFFSRAEKFRIGDPDTGQQVACIMADIDKFKSINDTWGHAVGDQVIKYFSGVLKGMVRGDDALCRYGGEEFCILLPRCDIDNAVLIAERMRSRVVDGAAGAIEGVPEIWIAGSFGVSSSIYEAHDIEELIGQADAALYAAKEGGRNRVVRYNPAGERGALPEVEQAGNQATGVGR